MKPIHKFNGGYGATICHDCRVIIRIGCGDELYCNDCKYEKIDSKVIDRNTKKVVYEYKKTDEKNT